ncbi:diacylglycerol/lipid kinase family protein [Corynebacterium sp. 335C]
MRALLISNPNSTSITHGLMARVVPELTATPGLDIEARYTAYAGHATEMCRGLTNEDVDVVICVGGDGTVNEVINGLLADGPRDLATLPHVAVIPTGSANVLAGALGLPREPRLAAGVLSDLIARGTTRDITLGRADGQWFTVNTGMGVDADVITTMDDLRADGVSANPVRYIPTVIGAWLRIRRNPPEITAVVDGEEFARDVPMLVVSNSNPWTFLGLLPVVTNPGTRLDTGLGVWALTSLTGVRGLLAMLRLAGVAPFPWQSKSIEHREMRLDDVSRIELSSPRDLKFQVDGEAEGERSSVTVEAAPGALRMVAPKADLDFANSSDPDVPWWRRLLDSVKRRVKAVSHLAM